MVRFPVEFSATPITEYRPARLAGEHSHILRWLDA